MTVPEPLRLKRYGTVFARWLLIAVLVFVLAIFSGLYITENLLHKVYTATAQIQIRPRGETGTAPLAPGPNSPRLQAEFDTMRSPGLLMPIITDLQLDQIWASRMDKSSSNALTPEDAVAYLNKRLRLDCARGTNIINITVSSAVPKEAAEIANAIADRYKTLRDAQENQLKQVEADRHLQQSPVRILSRAETPRGPSKPDKNFAFLVTVVVAAFLSAVVASFVEVILLFLRAGEAD